MALYGLFSLIDGAIYGFVKDVVKLIILLANYDFFRKDLIGDLAKRVYIVLGVLVLFKIVISCVQYMVNPDTFDDKDKGMGGILKKTIISIALLAVTPSLFDFAIQIQQSVVMTIPSIVLGNNGRSYQLDSSGARDQLENIGETVAVSTIKAFVTPTDGVYGFSTIDGFKTNVKKGCSKSIFKLFDTSGCEEVYHYMMGISTIAGGFLLYVLISMSLDVGIRAIKLGIIQMFAPIPISGYIVSKDKLSKFFKLAMNVYLDLFIRLIVIYFIVFFVNNIIVSMTSPPVIAGFQTTSAENMYLKVIIIIALFMFAKSAPKFITDVLGINSEGMGDLAGMFKSPFQRSGLLGAAAGMGKAGIANFANRVSQQKPGGDPNASFGKKLKSAMKDKKTWGSALAGMSSAGVHGLRAAIEGKSGKEAMRAGADRAIQARRNRELDELNGIKGYEGWKTRMKAKAYDSLGIDTAASLAEGQQKAFSTLHQDVGDFKKAVLGRLTKEAGNISIRTSGKNSSAMMQLGQLLASQRVAIEASGNQGLISMFNKFDMEENADGTVTCKGLREGQNITYSELRATAADAQQCGIGEIADRTNENGDITLLAQKELFSDAMEGKVMDGTGKHESTSVNVKKAFSYDKNGHVITDADGNYVYNKDANGNLIYTDNENAHVDVTTAVGKAKQHIAENAVSIGPLARVQYRDEDGNVLESTQDDMLSGAESLQNAFETNFAKLDDAVQRKSAEVSTSMGSDPLAAARAANQRRDANKKENK